MAVIRYAPAGARINRAPDNAAVGSPRVTTRRTGYAEQAPVLAEQTRQLMTDFAVKVPAIVGDVVEALPTRTGLIR